MDKFWMVWRENGDIPRYKHATEASAKQEAERLARNNPGVKFYVLVSVDACRLIDVLWENQQGEDDYNPF